MAEAWEPAHTGIGAGCWEVASRLSWLGQAVLARAGPGVASRAGRAGPGRHRLELDLGCILEGQMEVDLGAIFGGPGGPGPGRAGTVWSSIWEPFWEAKLEVDLGAIFAGPNRLFLLS